jgi:hypothetical protein
MPPETPPSAMPCYHIAASWNIKRFLFANNDPTYLLCDLVEFRMHPQFTGGRATTHAASNSRPIGFTFVVYLPDATFHVREMS